MLLSSIFVLHFAMGSESAGHLIHRGAVPLPLEGKDNAPPKLRRVFDCPALLLIETGDRITYFSKYCNREKQ